MTEKLSKTEVTNTSKVAISNTVSKFGDILFDFINSTFLTHIAGGSLWLSFYQSSEVLVSIFFNLWGGVVSDNNDRQKIIWHCDLISGLVCILLAVFIPKRIFVYAILLINIALAVISSFRSPAYKAVFKEIVFDEHLSQVNSVLEVAKQSIQIAGPAFSVLVANWLGNKNALIFDGITFIISGLLIKWLVPLTAAKPKTKKQTTLAEIWSGLQYIFAHQEILLIILCSSVVNFVIAGYNLILPFAIAAFKDPQLNAYATFLTAESVGGLIGASASILLKKAPSTNLLLSLLLLCGICLSACTPLYGLSHSVIIASISVAAFNLFLSVFNIQFMSFVQIRTDSNYLGRVFGTIFSVAILFMPVGTFFFKFALQMSNPNNYLYLGFALVAITIITFIFHLLTSQSNNN